ncbi:MAG: hypothetical protein Tp158DCM1229571_17 [Prokaryotic dsDNA virus sp.]|nr:MAG: hypothetical protein Tp158DCM1229571_17 [Prokaryotic dsDNA virus sp.]|tara:strand:- start:65690 stop:66220 length:531 start_codon:yes stop_codon:yes gene_type:complete
MSLVAVDPNRDYRTEIMDEISRTYYPRRGRFLSDQEAYPTDINGNIRVPQIPNDIFNRSPIYGGAYNIPGAAGNLAQGLPFGVQGPAQGPNTPIKMYPGMGYGPVGPAGGGLPPTPMPDLAEMPRFIRGYYRPERGVFGSPPPNLDSPFMDERIKRGFVPMTPPVRRPGPQLPGFV